MILLVSLIRDNLFWLKKRVHSYATIYGFTKYISMTDGELDISIKNVSRQLIETTINHPKHLELTADTIFLEDKLPCILDILCLSHQKNNISWSFFLGLLKYYRQSYLDLIEKHINLINKKKNYFDFVNVFFDRLEIVLLIECQNYQVKNSTLHKSQEEEHYKLVADFATNWEYWLSPDNEIIYNSPSCQQITGFDTTEFIKNPNRLVEIVYWEDRDVLLTHIKKSMINRDVLSIQFRIIHKNGTIKWIGHTCQPVYDAQGNFLGRRASNRDITDLKTTETQLYETHVMLEKKVEQRTLELALANQELQLEIAERKKTEKMLAMEKERLSITLDSIGDGVITTNILGRITSLNRAAQELTQWEKREAINKPLDKVFKILNTKTGKPCVNAIDKVLLTGEIVEHTIDTKLITRDGSEKLIASNGAPIRNHNNKIVGAVMVFRDVSHIHKLEEDIHKTNKLEAVGILAGGIAHDFNNILTIILGNISLAKMRIDDVKMVVNKLDEIQKASKEAINLTQQFLTFAKGGTLIKKTDSIGEIVKEAATFALTGSNVNLEMNIAEDLWLVEIDSGQIYQVINNIVINAKQAMPNGGSISITAENIVISEDNKELSNLLVGQYVKISIKDQGLGIPSELLSNIFDPYFTTKETGHGLGLASSYYIIKKHDGYIDVKSFLNKGTCFSIYLPISKSTIRPVVKKEVTIKYGKGKIMIMDDHLKVRETSAKMLLELGYQVVLAKNGEEAVKLYTKSLKEGKRIDLAILDLTVKGGLGGQETIKNLRQINPYIKAIVCSGYSNNHIMSNYKNYGFDNFLLKPYKIEELSQIINLVLNKK